MPFAAEGPAPGIQRVIDYEPRAQERLVVGDIGAESQRDREQARGLRRPVEGVGVGGPYYLGEPGERRIRERVLDQESVETARRAVVCKLDPGMSKRMAGSSRATRRTSAGGT